MDPSALIFVALAVAWVVYLLPKALKHHESVQRSRSVDRFSHRMRVLARREPTSSRAARLVVQPGRAPSRPVVETKGPAPVVSVAARRAAAQRAARRRRNVLSVILLGLVVVTALAGAGVFSWWYVAVPGGLLVAWLVACRLMVKSERRARRVSQPVRRPAPGAVPTGSVELDEDDAPTAAHPVVTVDLRDSSLTLPVVDAELADDDPSRWDMVPVTLPTYVSKPAAQRTVQTIDLDSTGVWTSGHSESESALARTAQEIKRAEALAAEQAQQRRAVGH